MTKRTPPFSPEVCERAVRMVQEHQGEHSSRHAAIRSIASKIGCSGETLRNWIEEAESSKGPRAGSSIALAVEYNASSIRYTERLVEAGIEPSFGSMGDSYDNALADTINGLFKAE